MTSLIHEDTVTLLNVIKNGRVNLEVVVLVISPSILCTQNPKQAIFATKRRH